MKPLTLLVLGCLLAPMLHAYDVSYGQSRVVVDGVEASEWDHLNEMLMDQLTLNGSAPAGEPLADDLAFFTRQHFIKQGWPEAQVTWKLEPGLMRLIINSGRRVLVGEVKFRGNTVLTPEELRPYLMKPTLEREDVDSKLPYWVEADVQQGAELVQRRLRAEGHLQAKVELIPDSEPGADMRRGLTLDITPGPKFVFGSLSVEGHPAELDKQVLVLMTETGGSPFNEARVQQIEQRLSSLCVKHGWLHATATSEYTLRPGGGTINVLFHVKPGERVRIVSLSVHPAFSRGAQRVLNARFKPLQGQIYESEEADFYFRRALDTGMFALLDTEVLPVAGDPTAGVLRITGEETQPVTLGFEAGFDTFLGGQAGVTYKNTNWRNTGDTLSAALNYSTAGPRGFVSHTNPALFGSSYATTSRLALEQFNRYEYNRITSAVNLELSKRVNIPFSFGFFVGGSNSTVDSKILTPPQLGPLSYQLASIGGNFILDKRDSPVLPRKGWYLSGRLESTTVIGGSGVSYLRTDLRAAVYQPITQKFRFAAVADLATVQGATAEELPIDSRVFNGGPNSVRSFAQRELGPMSGGGTPLGGTSALYASAEFSYEVISNLEIAMFTDVGSLESGPINSPLAYSSDFRYAVGLGLRYKLPFGPIRIDYGHNPSPRVGEKSSMLHVTVGFAF